jgi:hypothetical protein
MAENEYDLYDAALLAGGGLGAMDLNEPGRHPELAERGFTYLHRPLLFGQAETERFERDLLTVTGLLTELPGRVFGGDVELTCRELGIDPAKADLIGAFSRRPVPSFGRIDAYHDGGSLKILEFNATSAAGGQEWVSVLGRAYREYASFSRFAAARGLYTYDTVRLLAESLRKAHAEAGGTGDPTIALVEGEGGLSKYGRAWHPLHRQLLELGLNCHVCEIQDLHIKPGRISVNGSRVDILYRVYGLGQALETPRIRELAGQVARAHEDGDVTLWTPYETEVHRNKRWLARLSDRGLGAGLTQAEQSAVDRVLPWTRELTERVRADEPELWQRFLAEQRELVIKPGDGFGGQGITFGWQVDADRWAAALTECAAIGGVVQRRVNPRVERIVDPATGTPREWEACWGLFWLPGGFAGGGARLVPHGSPADADRASKRMAGLYIVPESETRR